MEIMASAPGKVILFGEHAVVYGQPAMAFAVNKRAFIHLKPGSGGKSTIKSLDLNLDISIDLNEEKKDFKREKRSIINYIIAALYEVHDGSPLDIQLRLEIPVGAGLGSSAAVTVATLAAAYQYHHKKISNSQLAKKAHEVELTVQGRASSLDTAVSTYGGLIYLNEQREIISLKYNLPDSLVIGYTSYSGNTAEMVDSVREKRDRFPEIMDPIIISIGKIASQARKIIAQDDLDLNYLGELMNINHGLLDSMGVNTKEISNMIFNARRSGAIGAKITGAGGGGSIIAFCPGKIDEVLRVLQKTDDALQVDFSRTGFKIHY